MKPARRYTTMAAAAGILAALLALPAGAQDTPAIPDLDPAGCSNGTYVAESNKLFNPALIADCRTLVSIRNHWTRQTVPPGSPLLTWGTGRINTWPGIVNQNGRVAGIDLSGYGLTGPIPADLAQLTNLQGLTLDDNQLTGTIPTELGNLTQLWGLSLDDNQLTGPIPADLAQLTNLQYLYLRRNELTGRIPTELGRLTQLTGLYLGGNELTGTIPTELGNLTKLEFLSLYDNELAGRIPAELGQLTNLTNLNLRTNQLTGPIPPQIGNLTELTSLSLRDNQLTGPIPAELGQLTKLETLWMFGNQLTGPIPAELGQLTKLESLYLGGNQLTGTIPASLTQQLTYQITELRCPPLFNGRFCDDDTISHESSIDAIAAWGITRGCGPSTQPRYCPGDSITRQQMATFLHRAVTHRTGTEPTTADPSVPNDVQESSPNLRYIQWAVAAGVMQTPEGLFNPYGTVTRADMAEMMAAAFDHITPPPAAQGIFTDMAGQPDTVTRAAEALRTAGVTAGCSASPPRYCPDQPVTRAQMASFFARALS